MKRKLFSLLTSLSLVLSGLMLFPTQAKAEITPTVIFSAIESGSIEIELNNAIYPITGTSTRNWYCDGSQVIPDGTLIIDNSVGQTAKLKLAVVATTNHMQNYAVIDTTPSPQGTIVSDQIARLYVISLANFNAATLTVKPIEAPVGEDLIAKNLTLYIDSTPYPNFQSLRFLDGALVKDKITVEEGTNTYTLVDTITSRTTTVNVTGVVDSEAPKITSLSVTDNKADKYATKKTLRVTATDNVGLDQAPYYWENNTSLANEIKERVMDGKKASEIEGITWEKSDTHTVTDVGSYTVFVKDKAGNIAYKDIKVVKITNDPPTISSLVLGKDGDTVYIDVTASDPNKQPLQYKINDSDWQSSDRLTKVKDGTNTIYVRNEAGVEAKATKDIFLDVYKDEVAAFTAENLYNYIQISPVGWTNKQVKVSLVLPDSITPKLSTSPFSVNGAAFGSNRTYTVTENDTTVIFTVKDIYGKTHTSKAYKVINIDKDAPSIEVSSNEEGVIHVKSQDYLSGVSKIVVNSTNAANYMIKANGASVATDEAYYKAPANGSYQFVVYDFAGNTASATAVINCYDETKVQSALKDSKIGTDKKTGATRSGNTTGGKSGSSTLGTKASSEKSGGTRAKTNNSGDSGYTLISTAGNSVSPTLPEAEKIGLVRQDENASSAPAQMIQEATLDNTNTDLVKKLLLFGLPLICIGAVVAVIIVNIGKGKFKKK